MLYFSLRILHSLQWVDWWMGLVKGLGGYELWNVRCACTLYVLMLE